MVNSVFVKNVVLLSTKDIITVRTNENESMHKNIIKII